MLFFAITLLFCNSFVHAEQCIFIEDKNNKLSVTCKTGYQYDSINIDELFKKFPMLESLTIKDVSVHKIPEGLTRFRRLKQLEVTNVWKVNLPHDLIMLSSLNKLTLINIQLQAIPNSIEKLKNLENLTVDFNAIIEVPESLCSIVSLRVLSVQNNLLTALPLTFLNLANLYTLNLDNNKFETVPECLHSFRQINNISMSGNMLKEFPVDLLEIPTLATLNLESNVIASLPDNMKISSKLINLIISTNPLKQPVEKVLSAVKKILDFRKLNTHMTQLPPSFKSFKDGSIIAFIGDSPIYLSSSILQLYFNGTRPLPFNNPWLKYLDNTYLKQNKALLENKLNAVLDKEKNEREVSDISLYGIYNTISSEKMHWNLNTLRLSKRYPDHEEVVCNDNIVEVWDNFMFKNAENTANEDVFRRYLIRINSIFYIKNMTPFDVTAKAYINLIVHSLILPQNSSKVSRFLDIFCQHVFLPKKQFILGLDFCYNVFLKKKINQNCEIKIFIENFISLQKDKTLESIVRTEDISDYVFNYYFWINKIGKELGYNFKSNTFVTAVKDVKFNENYLLVLNEFFDVFTPNSLISMLTLEINKNTKLVNKIYFFINDLIPQQYNKMFLYMEDYTDIPYEIKPAGVQYYLFQNGYLEYFDKVRNGTKRYNN